MDSLFRSLRYSTRQLLKTPGFALAVVLILALGIGATTSIFSLVEGVLLRPLPFSDPDRLVALGDRVGDNPGVSVTAREIPLYLDDARAFSSVGAFTGASYELFGGASPEKVDGARLTAGVFTALGVQPMLGRVFSAEEEDAREPLAVLSYSMWLTRYHADRHVLGSSITLNRKPYTILGVMPRSFEFPVQRGRLDRTELWVPMSLTGDEQSLENTGFWGYQMIARLRDGQTLQQGAQDADRLAREAMREFPPNMKTIVIRGDLIPLREQAVANTRSSLRILFLAVSVVLLLACANVAGLMLVRAIRRRREFAVRLALGARAELIVRDSVVEGMLLSLAGGVLGLTLTAVAVRCALHVLPDAMPRIDSVRVDWGVALFALLLGLITGTLCSLGPAFTALRTNLIQSLKEGAAMGSGLGAASHTWLRSALVVAEIAIALVLLNLSGAFLRSFDKMLAVDPGFRPDQVLVAHFELPINLYPTETSAENFRRALMGQLAGKPGVLAAGGTDSLPATGFTGMSGFTIEGQRAETWKLKFAAFATTYGDFFQAMGIPLIAGRTFTSGDRPDTPLVILVNQSMARDCWPGQPAIGKRMHVGNPHKGYPWATVIGVVADTKRGARDEPSGDQWYAPAQQPAILYGADFSGILTHPEGGFIALRSALPPEQMAQTLRAAVAQVDPLLPLEDVQTMNEVVENIEAPRRFNTSLIAGFALGALLLAITGIYAVVAFSVSLRTQEIAIRMALGAQRGGIARLVLLSGARMALIGCGLGVVGSIAVSRLAGSFLFGVSANDPATYAASVAIMIAMAMLASAVPAVRAASADPVRALRAV